MKKQKTYFHPKNRDGIWLFIRAAKNFTADEVVKEVGVEAMTVRNYLKALLNGGYVTEVKAAKNAPASYKLKNDIGRHRPELLPDGTAKPQSVQQRLWAAMKVLKVFEFQDLALSARVPAATAKEYCLALKKADYLRVREKATAKQPELYGFNHLKDTGFYAPQIKRPVTVYDRNLHEVVWTQPDKEVA